LFLVEGETEELCLPILFKHFGINTDSSGISFIAVNGKNQIPKYWRLFKSFGIQTEVIIDNDDDTNGDKRSSNNNIASCFYTSIDEILNIEDKANIKVLQCANDELFDQRIFILKTDFETAFKEDFEKYCNENSIENKYKGLSDDAQNLIKPVNNSQKGQMARYIATNILNEYPDYKPHFIRVIVDALGLTSEVPNSEITNDEMTDDLPF
jgi:putative ATP-dependent endonuclease of OLD family